MEPRETDTIVALATPPGEGGLGVVRLSGPRALAVANALFHAAAPLLDVPSHTLHHGIVHDGTETMDDAVATVFRAPRSYTGEDVVELSCHGGHLLLTRVLELCLARGARLAGPGEFTRRAYENGKMDLTQAEAVAELIAARSDTVRRAGLAQLRGGLTRRLAALRQGLVDLLAQLEAGLDFVDDEVPPLSMDQFQKHLKYLREALDGLLATARDGRWLRKGLRVALAGRPNAGKSSLFNALLGDDRAIVAARPGTTRDTLEEQFFLNDVPVTLTDTAGLRRAAGAAERAGVARARRALARAEVVLGVIDGSKNPGSPDRRLAAAWRRGRTILVLAKADRLKSAEARERREASWRRALAWGARPGLWISSRAGTGLPELRSEILEAAGVGGLRERREDDVLINTRHEAGLREARAALEEAGRDTTPAEARALDLRRALGALSAVTGRDGDDVSEEVLDAIFSRFCIGK